MSTSTEVIIHYYMSPGVLGFIAEHPVVIPVLEAAPEQIEKQFPGAHLSLRIEDGMLWITAWESEDIDAKEYVRRLHAIDDEWWIDTSYAVQQTGVDMGLMVDPYSMPRDS